MQETQKPVTVSEFTAAAKQQIEQTAGAAHVVGEVANFTRAASGHWYFSLRDEHAQLDCVMLARQNRLAETVPANGDKVVVFGAAALYAPRARFQLAVRFLYLDGVGHLYRLFIQRKQQWQARGWFDKAAPLPPLPQTLGIVCSAAGAALHDVLRTLKSRYPLLQVIIYPAPAQGADAAEKIAAMINTAAKRRECDVLLLCRGGGGMEDLWAYNEEAVVAAVYACPIPVISGIGHDTDTTLADYAADKHCPTPTAAATAAVADAAALQQQLNNGSAALIRHLQQAADTAAQRLDWAVRWLALPRHVLAEKQQQWMQRHSALQAAIHQQMARWQKAFSGAARLPRVDTRPLQTRLLGSIHHMQQAVKAQTAARQATLIKNETALELLSPQKLLQRGYSIVNDAAGQAVNSVQKVHTGDTLTIRFYDGTVKAKACRAKE